MHPSAKNCRKSKILFKRRFVKKTKKLNATMPKSYRLALIHMHWCFVSSDAEYLFAEQVHFLPFMFTNCMYNTIYITEISFFLSKIFHLPSNAIWPPEQRAFHLLAHFWVKRHSHQLLIVSQLWYDFGYKHMVSNKACFFNVKSKPCFEPHWCPVMHVFSSTAIKTLGYSFKSKQ